MNERERLERVRQRQDGEIENLKVSARERQEELRRARQFSEQVRVEFQRKEHALKKTFEEEKENFSKTTASNEGGEMEKCKREIEARERARELFGDENKRVRRIDERDGQSTWEGTGSVETRDEDRGEPGEAMRRRIDDGRSDAGGSDAPLVKQMEIVNEEKMRESERREEEEHRMKQVYVETERKRKEMEGEVAKMRMSLTEEKKKYEMLFTSLKVKVDEMDALDTKRREALEVVKETQTEMHDMREKEKRFTKSVHVDGEAVATRETQESELREREKVLKAQLMETKNELEANVKFGGGGDGQSYNNKEIEEEEEENTPRRSCYRIRLRIGHESNRNHRHSNAQTKTERINE